MAGFWHLSHHQMRDMNGAVYAGAKAYFTSATTLLSLTVYQDYGLGTPHPNPVQANAYGIFPPVFFDETDEFYRQRITSSGGILVPGTDVGTLPIIGPSGGGGGSEVPVDANALLKTGYTLWLPLAGALAGFVRANARTIGSVSSGASERANADCEALYLALYAEYADATCPVSGGRGVTAAADWAANKPIGLLDLRGRSAFGLDGMGNSLAGLIDNDYVATGDANNRASIGGADDIALATTDLPSHTHTPTANPLDVHTHDIVNIDDATAATVDIAPTSSLTKTWISGAADLAYQFKGTSTVPTRGVSGPKEGTVPAVTIGNTGGGSAHNNMPPFVLGTWYVKL